MSFSKRACVKSKDGLRGGVFVAPAKAGAQMPPLVDGSMTLDSGLRRNDVQGIMPCTHIFEHRPLALAWLADSSRYRP